MVALSRNLIRFTATALLVAAGVFVSPGRAAADCGDYVTVAGQSPAHTMPADDTKPDTPRKPCSGVNCSKKQDSPAAPVRTPTPPTDTKSVGATFDADALPPADGRGWVIVSTSDRPISTSTSVFHPPRSV